MMRVWLIPLLVLNAAGQAQEYVEPEWLPPPPPEYQEFCGDQEKTSQPILSYRVSPVCTLTDVHPVGEYQFGTEQVRAEVRDLFSSEMIRRFEGGNFIHYREVRIELHKAMEPRSVLLCTTDMMGKKVIDARVVREKLPGESGPSSREQPVQVENNQLPNLGVFTYTSTVTYSTNNCPE